jgi:hypothetical protein
MMVGMPIIHLVYFCTILKPYLKRSKQLTKDANNGAKTVLEVVLINALVVSLLWKHQAENERNRSMGNMRPLEQTAD